MTSECKPVTDLKINNPGGSSTRCRSGKQKPMAEKPAAEKPEKRSLSKETPKNTFLQNQLQMCMMCFLLVSEESKIAKNQECQVLKSQVVKLQKNLTKKANRNKRESSTATTANQPDTCMTEIILEKTRMLKNQELQIEALTQQVCSLKDVITITKDMLDIRNIEVKQLNDKLHCMDVKFSAEKDRHKLVYTELERMVALNTDLKDEYKKQLCIFSELQKSYQGHISNCKYYNLVEKPAKADSQKSENKVLIVRQPDSEFGTDNEKLPANVSNATKGEKVDNKIDVLSLSPETHLSESETNNIRKTVKTITVQAKGDTLNVDTSAAKSNKQVTNEDLKKEIVAQESLDEI